MAGGKKNGHRGRAQVLKMQTSGIIMNFVDSRSSSIRLSEEQKFQLLCWPEKKLFPLVKQVIKDVIDIRSFHLWLIRVVEEY